MLVLQAKELEFKSKKSSFGKETYNSSANREAEAPGNPGAHLSASLATLVHPHMQVHTYANTYMRARTHMCAHTHQLVCTHSDCYAMQEMDKSRI